MHVRRLHGGDMVFRSRLVVLVETMIEYMKEYRVGPDGKATFAIVAGRKTNMAAVGMVMARPGRARAHDGDGVREFR